MIWVAVVITMLLFILVAKPTGIYLELFKVVKAR